MRCRFWVVPLLAAAAAAALGVVVPTGGGGAPPGLSQEVAPPPGPSAGVSDGLVEGAPAPAQPPSPPPSPPVLRAGTGPSGPLRPGGLDMCGESGVPVIDNLTYYTPRAEREAGGTDAVRELIRRAEVMANQAFADSGAQVRVRVLRVEPLLGLPSRLDDVTPNLLRAVTRPRDSVVDSVHELRERLGADQVTVVAGGRRSGGYAWQPVPPTGRTWNQGFSVVSAAGIPGHSWVHELAHNLGATHDWIADPHYYPALPGNHGHLDPVGGWTTLMAYERSCRRAGGGHCERLNLFANPELRYQGRPLGVPVGKPRAADVVSVLNRTAPTVAGYLNAGASPC